MSFLCTVVWRHTKHKWSETCYRHCVPLSLYWGQYMQEGNFAECSHAVESGWARVCASIKTITPGWLTWHGHPNVHADIDKSQPCMHHHSASTGIVVQNCVFWFLRLRGHSVCTPVSQLCIADTGAARNSSKMWGFLPHTWANSFKTPTLNACVHSAGLCIK